MTKLKRANLSYIFSVTSFAGAFLVLDESKNSNGGHVDEIYLTFFWRFSWLLLTISAIYFHFVSRSIIRSENLPDIDNNDARDFVNNLRFTTARFTKICLLAAWWAQGISIGTLIPVVLFLIWK